jgi:RNA polymerase sigma factor (sigma-70 family)
MVHDVCRAVTGSAADADDAFQAVFLVLACRAAGVRSRGSLGPWLFGVARRTALRARKQAARRREREAAAAAMTPTTSTPPRPDDSVAALIEEVDRLPSRYREPIVLCHLQGLSYEDAAGRLGCPSSTLGVRLKRARERLRTRLERRGVDSPALALPGSALTNALADATSRLALLVAPSLRGGVPVSVLFLTRGALRTMRMTRMVTTSAAFLALAAGAWAWNASASSDGATLAAPTSARADAAGKYRLTGKVTDPETGEAVAGATIRVSDPDGKRPVEAVSGPDGTYSLPLPAGNVGTRSFVPPPGFWSLNNRYGMEPMRLSDAQPEVKQDFSAVRGTAWEFRLIWAASGKPAGLANVLTSPRGGRSLAIADDEGKARIGLPREAGEAELSIDPPDPLGWTARRRTAKLRWDDRFDPDALRDVSRLSGNVARYWLTDGEGRAAMIEEPEGGRFTPRIEAGRLIVDVAVPEPTTDVLPDVVGAVVDRAGNPIAGATVELIYVWEREDGSSSESANLSDRCRGTTDERGRYRLADVPATIGGDRPTSIQLGISRPGFVLAGAGPVKIPAEGPLEVPDVVMGPGSSVIGTVVDPDHKPVVGALIDYSTIHLIRNVMTRTDAAGRFRLDGLPERQVRLHIRHGELNYRGPAPVASRDPESIEFQLSPPPHAEPPNP